MQPMTQCCEARASPTLHAESIRRILFAVNTPWTEKLGVPRVSIELARHLEMLGHTCEKYSWEDTGMRQNKITGPFGVARFQRKLLKHIRKHGHQYDVIQAECNLLPFPRSAYRFDGILIAKSNGLPHLYHRYLNKDILPRLQREAGERGTLIGNAVRSLARWVNGGLRAVEGSFEAADKIHLLNQDEMAFVRDELGFGDKCVYVPNGLSNERAAALAASATPEQRAASDTVVFIGTWSLRKGKLEFPKIVRLVRAARPATRFRLIGTYTDAATVQAAFDPQDREHVEVIPQYDPDELPRLLADARCGVFPSYIEGFPLGVLEMLAAGIPVVVWDVPGPREMLQGGGAGSLIPAGDVQATAEAVLGSFAQQLLTSENDAVFEIANSFRWGRITDRFSTSVSTTRNEVTAL